MKEKRTEYREAFASRLKELLEVYKYSQRQVSRKIECSVSCVSKWLTLSREPTLSNIWKLADLFECSIDILVGRQPLPK